MVCSYEDVNEFHKMLGISWLADELLAACGEPRINKGQARPFT